MIGIAILSPTATPVISTKFPRGVFGFGINLSLVKLIFHSAGTKNIGMQYTNLDIIVLMMASLAATLELPYSTPDLSSLTVIPVYNSPLLMKKTLVFVESITAE